MKYRFEKTNDKNKMIVFEENKYLGLQELINTIDLYSITLEDILNEIELVQSGNVSKSEIGTEKAMIEITMETSEIYDLFIGLLDDDDLFPTIKISTDELKKVIMDAISSYK